MVFLKILRLLSGCSLTSSSAFKVAFTIDGESAFEKRYGLDFCFNNSTTPFFAQMNPPEAPPSA